MPVTQAHPFHKSSKGETNQAKSEHLSADLGLARPAFRYQLCDGGFLDIHFPVYKVGCDSWARLTVL